VKQNRCDQPAREKVRVSGLFAPTIECCAQDKGTNTDQAEAGGFWHSADDQAPLDQSGLLAKINIGKE
jgi:hypothetical protein